MKDRIYEVFDKYVVFPFQFTVFLGAVGFVASEAFVRSVFKKYRHGRR